MASKYPVDFGASDIRLSPAFVLETNLASINFARNGPAEGYEKCANRAKYIPRE